MYQALYRKWRPRTFEEVVGQEHITTTLKNEMIQGKPAHAYLLMGSRGTGKTTCAKLIAKAVNCRNPVDGSPCGQCDCCRGVDNGSLVDVVEIDAASNNGVDNIRDLREEAVFLPNIAKYRVYIIDEAHMLSVGAVNALLKIMEEPPEHVIFILATTEVHKIPATIQSRCQRFDFKRIAPEVIRDRLLFIAGQEDMTLTEEAAALIARIADGGMRDALSLLDLCWAHAHDITVETVSEAAGLVGQDYLFEIADAAATGDFTGAMDAMERLAGQAVEYDRLCSQLISHYRNLLVAATARDPEQLIGFLYPGRADGCDQNAAGYPGRYSSQHQPPGGDGTGSLKAQRPAGKPQPGSAGRPHRGAGSQAQPAAGGGDPPRSGPGAADGCRRNVPATTRGTGRTGAGSAARHGAAPAAGGSSPTGCKACRYPGGANAGGSVAAGAGSSWRHQ